SDDKGNNVSFGLPYNDTMWHLYDVTYDGSTLTAYADGRNIGSAVMTLDTKPVGTALDIGSSGSYDEAAVYPTALSAARITARWLASGNAPPVGGVPGAQELPPGEHVRELFTGSDPRLFG